MAEPGSLMSRCADFLQRRSAAIVQRIVDRIFLEIPAYAQGHIPRVESESTNTRLLAVMVDVLSWPADRKLAFTADAMPMLKEFEADIAARRITYHLDLKDLLQAVVTAQNIVWEALRGELGGAHLEGREFFALEERLNHLIRYFYIVVVESYTHYQQEVIQSQDVSLKQWDEVVKSASYIELKIPCRPEFAGIVRMQAEAIARRLHYDEEGVQDLKFAVGEACDNAIEHGLSPRGVVVRYIVSPSHLNVEIQDFGPGFDPTGRGETPPDVYAERGRGLFMMKQLTESVNVRSEPGQGAWVRLTKPRVMT